MTSFLVQEEDQNAKLATVDYLVDEEKKSESKSNESTNQSEGRNLNQTTKSDQDNLVAEEIMPGSSKKLKPQLTIEWGQKYM